ncbi:MAG: NAD(P)-dependent oxidoreductase [archaeon]|nr:NAD(P)-dependent oxidoreductase [archaeon]MCP8319804.1 NAD(P)-dependent oxidoreductase [archaeon]
MSPCYHDFFRANVVGTRNVCKLAFIKRVRRFIHVSSIDVHGPIPRHLIPISEDHPLNPTESYEKTKAQAEKIVRWYADQGLPIIILRPAYVYGPGDRGYFHPLIQMIHQLPFIPLLAAGRALKHLICIDDLIRALELSLSKGKLGGIYFVGEHYPITIREILALLCRAFSIRKPFINLPLTAKQASIMSYFLPSYMRYFLAWFYKNYGCRIDAIKRDMDFNPSITLEQVLFRSPPNTIYLGGNN